MWLAWGLAMLTKGPPALLPLAALVVALGLARDGRGLRRLVEPAGLALFFLIGFGWYLWVVATRPDLAGYFLGHEVYDRVFTSVHQRNARWYGAFESKCMDSRSASACSRGHRCCSVRERSELHRVCRTVIRGRNATGWSSAAGCSCR